MNEADNRQWPSQGQDEARFVAGELFWFALRTARRREKMAAEFLRAKGYEEFLPTYVSRRKWSDRYKDLELPLFPGYVFCRFDPRVRLPVLTTPGVTAVVGHGRVPVPVEDSEIDTLKIVVASRVYVEPWRYVNVGDRVVIETGPLAGITGLLQQIRGSCRVIVSVELLQRSVAVEVDRTSLRPLVDNYRRRVLAAQVGLPCV